jgi:hypothetical protein
MAIAGDAEEKMRTKTRAVFISQTGGKIVFESSFTLRTIQPFFFASALGAWLNVPISDSAP